MKFGRVSWWRMLVAGVAIAHVAILVSVAVFPVPWTGHRMGGRFPDGWVNLVPLATIRPVLDGEALPGATRLLVLNTFVLFPAGIYIPLLVPAARSVRGLVTLTVVGGASIELAQLAIIGVIGMPYRSIDIDDAILNAIGLVLGWLVVRLTLRILARRAISTS